MPFPFYKKVSPLQGLGCRLLLLTPGFTRGYDYDAPLGQIYLLLLSTIFILLILSFLRVHVNLLVNKVKISTFNIIALWVSVKQKNPGKSWDLIRLCNFWILNTIANSR